MAVRYRHRRESQPGEWSGALALLTTLARVRKLAKRFGGPYRIREQGEEFGQPRGLPGMLWHLRKRLKDAKVGEVFIVGCDRENIVIRVVEVELVIDTPGTDGIDRIYTEVVREFSGVENWGICNCRYISGTTTWSQHAYCRAWDIRPSSKAQGDAVAAWLRRNAERLGIESILWQVADHYDHIHVDLAPHLTSRPPCAG